MANAIKCPCQYIQGSGELKNLGKHVKKMGTKFLILLSANSKKRFGDTLKATLDEFELQYVFEECGPQCSLAEIERVTAVGKDAGCDAVITLGGGKVIDTGKAVATYLNAVSVIVPTIASNDSPCSGLSVVYNEEGVVVKVIYSKHNPDLVLVDTEIIAQAPVRFFVAGIGDALATYYEARACKASGARNMCRANATNTAMAMAKLCNDLLLTYGLEAKKAVEAKEPNEALENVLEASILLSGVGFESGGLAAAHAINDGFAYVEQAHGAMHGEKVAFGLLAQLVLEKVSDEEFNRILDFSIAMGLPVCFADLGITDVKEAELRKVAEAACVKTQSTKNLPFEVTEEDVYQALLMADKRGTARKL